MEDQFFKPYSRREFLKAAILAAPVLADDRLMAATGSAPGVSELRVGIIGLGRRGNFLRERFQKLCRVTSLCDVHRTRLSEAVAQSSVAARSFGDYRELLSSPNVDGVVIATPDHWHARMTLDALQAGKHVFCETPASRTLAETIALQEAAKASNLKIQVGTQGRANSAAFAACRYLREGQLGTLRTVRLWSAPDKALNQPSAASPPPAELDWRLWPGPLKERPFDETLFLGDWRFVDEIGGGRLVSHGAQLLALLQWFFGREFDGQVEVEPTSGPTKNPRTGRAQELRLAFGFKQPNLRCHWEIGPGDGNKPDWGIHCTGDKGELTMLGGDETCQVSREVFGYKSSRPFDDPAWDFAPDHRLNWLQCILNGGEPTMPLSMAAKAATACMVGRLALRLNRKLVWDFEAGAFVGDAEANALREELAEANPWTVRL